MEPLKSITKEELLHLAKVCEATQKLALRTLFFYLSQLSDDEQREEFISSVFYNGESRIDLTV